MDSKLQQTHNQLHHEPDAQTDIGHQNEEEQPEKKSMMQRVRDKARKIKTTIRNHGNNEEEEEEDDDAHDATLAQPKSNLETPSEMAEDRHPKPVTGHGMPLPSVPTGAAEDRHPKPATSHVSTGGYGTDLSEQSGPGQNQGTTEHVNQGGLPGSDPHDPQDIAGLDFYDSQDSSITGSGHHPSKELSFSDSNRQDRSDFGSDSHNPKDVSYLDSDRQDPSNLGSDSHPSKDQSFMDSDSKDSPIFGSDSYAPKDQSILGSAPHPSKDPSFMDSDTHAPKNPSILGLDRHAPKDPSILGSAPQPAKDLSFMDSDRQDPSILGSDSRAPKDPSILGSDHHAPKDQTIFGSDVHALKDQSNLSSDTHALTEDTHALKDPSIFGSDSHSPKDPSILGSDHSNSATTVTDPTHKNVKEAELSQQFEKMGIDSEPKTLDHNHPENPSPEGLTGNPSSQSGSYTSKISSSAYAAKDAIASKLGYPSQTPTPKTESHEPIKGSETPNVAENPPPEALTGNPSNQSGGYTSMIPSSAYAAKDAIASKLGYPSQTPTPKTESHEPIKGSKTPNVAENPPPEALTGNPSNQSGGYTSMIPSSAYAAKDAIASKLGYPSQTPTPKTESHEPIKGSKTPNVADKEVSVKERFTETIRPGDDDKSLSEMITQALHRGKSEKKEDGPRGTGSESVEPPIQHGLGTAGQGDEHGSDNVAAGKGVSGWVTDTVGSWFAKGDAPPGTKPDEGLPSKVTTDQTSGN